MVNPVLEAIRRRRSVARFKETSVDKKKIEAILEAGRWAPSWLNKQPFRFILVSDENVKNRLSEVLPTVFTRGVKEAPVCIAVTVDTTEDPYHYVEDGAAATQNMALAAFSLGLHTSWIGVFDVKGAKDSAEAKVREILEIPRSHRVVSILPVGLARNKIPDKERKMLYQLTYHNRFGNKLSLDSL